MATARLMPLHTGKGRSVAQALGRVTDYIENPEKTNGGKLVTAYQCSPSIADQEFLFAKRQYAAITSRERKDNDVIAYHLRQSFKLAPFAPGLVICRLVRLCAFLRTSENSPQIYARVLHFGRKSV